MSGERALSLGIDFGTTNTVVARASSPDEVQSLPLGEEPHRGPVHPSVLAFELSEQGGPARIVAETGSRAIHLASRYPDEFRYVQSFKSHVASRNFDGTTVFGRRLDFPDLLAAFLQRSGIAAEVRAIAGPKRIVVGRPVKFHGEQPDEALALARYGEGFRKAGIGDFALALEPVGGAFSFFRTLRQAACVLIADFGGGTSDFVIARFRVGATGVAAELIAHAGIGIAGDTFDFRIMQHALLDHFGAATSYRSNGKSLPVPRSYYSAFLRWHQLSRLRTARHLDPLKEIRKTAAEPDKIDNLINAIQSNKGLVISREVAAAKAQLSERDAATLSIDLGQGTLERRITRAAFERWIADDIRRIGETVDAMIAGSGLSERDIDRVFLVGGSSFIPAIQSLFLERFGAERLLAGERFSSVAEGLALVGQDAGATDWSGG